MVERRVLAFLLIIVALVLASGVTAGRFSMLGERVTMTTASITTTTQVSLSFVTITEHKTTTVTTTLSTAVREPPHSLPSPANSTAVIQGRFLLNGSVFATLSIDKPAYSPGELVHIKATITNITPDDLSLLLFGSLVKIVNSSEQVVWMYPEWALAMGLGPPPHLNMISLCLPERLSQLIIWQSIGIRLDSM